MADKSDFVTRRRPAWAKLSALLTRAHTDGIRRLTRDELRELGPLYRRAAADLAYARLRGADPNLVAQLNDLVTRAHGLLYAERGPGFGRLWRFLASGFPRLIRAHRLYIIAATVVFLLGGIVGAGVIASKPHMLRAIVPRMFADNDSYYAEREQARGRFEQRDAVKPQFAAELMTNNIRVAIFAFALGILGGFPTLLLLFYNGLPIGALAMQQVQNGRSVLFWSLILPHGIIEITAIMIAGAAGMLIGRALVAPGDLSRSDAVKVAAREAVRLLLGTVTLFIAAGLIESFVSPSNLPDVAKLGFAALTAIALAAYFRAGQKKTPPEADASGGAAPLP